MAPHVAVNEFDSSNSAPFWAPSESSSDVVTESFVSCGVSVWSKSGRPIGDVCVIEGSYPFKSIVAVIFTGRFACHR